MDDLSDQEQIETIKRWWREYGKTVVFAIVLGLAVGFGWRYWNQYKVKHAKQASLMYQKLQIAVAQQQEDAATALAARIMKKYQRTPYASMAALLVARTEVANNHLDAATKELQWVMDHGKMDSLKQIARLRSARILLAEKKYQPAFTVLKTVNDPMYQPMVDGVKGDIYRAMGKPTLAQQSYKAAYSGFETSGIVDPFLTMKLAE